MRISPSFHKYFCHVCHLAEIINTYAAQVQSYHGATESSDALAASHLIYKLQGIWESAATATPELAQIYRESITEQIDCNILDHGLDTERIDENQAAQTVCVVVNVLFLWEATERMCKASEQLKANASCLNSRFMAQVSQRKLLEYLCLMTGDSESHHLIEIQKSIDALMSGNGTSSHDIKDKVTMPEIEESNTDKLACHLDAEMLEASAWIYEQKVRFKPRYLTLSTDFDAGGSSRAALINDLKRFVTATVVSDDPDRFQVLWKATIGSAISSLVWRPPHTSGRSISKAPPSDPLVRRALRVLRMVHELHKAGYQRLRVLPYVNGSGTAWRAEITHSDNVQDDGFSLIDYDHEQNGLVARYSTSQGNQYFGWKDATAADARELARIFLERFGHLANLGQGLDWAYAGWLVDVIGWAEERGDQTGLVCLVQPDFDDPENMTRWQPPPPIRFSSK